MHFRRVTGGIRVSVTQPSTPASMEYRVAIWSYFDFFFNTQNAPKYLTFYLATQTQMEHDQSSYFCRGPDDFCWGPAPEGPTLVTGPRRQIETAKSLKGDTTLLTITPPECQCDASYYLPHRT